MYVSIYVFLKVHITQGNMDGSEMIISWITNDEPGTNTVLYGTSKYNLSFQAEGRVNQYKFFNYTSGFIHHCTLKNLKVIINLFTFSLLRIRVVPLVIFWKR